MKVTADRPAGNTGEGFQQPVKLAKGLYYGLLAYYSAPKEVLKFGKTDEFETKIALSFVVVLGANEKPLDYYSEAFAMPRLKLYYDPQGGMTSTYFSFLSTILAARFTPDELVAMPDEEMPDMDELVGMPVGFMIDPATKPNRNGLFTNKITEFLPITAGAKKALVPIFKGRVTGYTTDEPARLKLTKPTTAFEADLPADYYGAADDAGFADEGDDPIPF